MDPGGGWPATGTSPFHSLTCWIHGVSVDSCVTDCCVSQAQYGYIVVQMLMNHLDENSRKEAQIKVSIIDVLSVTVLIAAGGSIGIDLVICCL